MNETVMLDLMHGMGVVPVIKIEKLEDAVPLGQALLDGGLPLAEVTFRTETAADAIAVMRRELPDLVVGAGTVTSVELAKTAVDAGARYIITPGFNPQVVSWCLENDMPVFPGCSTASEVEAAQNMGLSVVKFFPAEQSGGLEKIKALTGPYPRMRFMPTGGIGLHNLQTYLAFPKIVACGGSFMVNDALVKAKDWNGIRDLTQKALDCVLQLELAHVGLYADSETEAQAIGRDFAALTGFGVDQKPKSLFVGTGIEVMHFPSAWKGHIAYTTPSLERAVYQFRRKGYTFDETTAVKGADGKLQLLYFAEPIGGFAVHLLRK